jgi:hypothetical protein
MAPSAKYSEKMALSLMNPRTQTTNSRVCHIFLSLRAFANDVCSYLFTLISCVWPVYQTVRVKDRSVALPDYERTAIALLNAGYYSGLISAVKACFLLPGTFMILDCPSGSGKTQAGVALRQLDYSKLHTDNSTKPFDTFNVRVVHLIWPSALNDENVQMVYKQIHDEHRAARLCSDGFFRHVMSCDFSCILNSKNQSDRKMLIWESFLKYLFNQLEPAEVDKMLELCTVGSVETKLLLFIDEIPEDPVGVRTVGFLRDSLRLLENVTLCLSGTNSKAANMVGVSVSLSQGAISSVYGSRQGDAWAFIMTRLPRFDLDFCPLKAEIDVCEYHYPTSVKLIREFIQHSIRSGGNSRLIFQAIDALIEVVLQARKQSNVWPDVPARFFMTWQKLFSKLVVASKFSFNSHSKAFKGLVGQVNLLLEATATSHLSDVLLGNHFAFRAVPNFAATYTSTPGVKLNQCGGWLCVASDSQRSLGSCFNFFKVSEVCKDMHRFPGYKNWQRTIFSPPKVDILLYLAACREGGYFTVFINSMTIAHKACDVLLDVWNRNAAGWINSQNPTAVTNNGNMLEVLLAIAIPNAAALASTTTRYSTLSQFLIHFADQLGVVVQSTLELGGLDSSVRIPRFVFPGKDMSDFFNKYVGSLERRPDADKFDLLLTCYGSPCVLFEAKDRLRLNNLELANASIQVMKGYHKVGVVAVRHCCQYWGEGARLDQNRAILATRLMGIAGKIVFISREGEIENIEVSKPKSGAVSERLLVIIQVSKDYIEETRLR